MPVGEGVKSITVVCEAHADRRVACELADRVLVEQVSWIEPEVLDDYRDWRGLQPGSSFLDIHQVPHLARERGIKVRGFFDNEPGGPRAAVARKALVLLTVCEHPPDAVLIVVDSDNDQKRRAGLDQARNAHPLAIPSLDRCTGSRGAGMLGAGWLCTRGSARGGNS